MLNMKAELLTINATWDVGTRMFLSFSKGALSAISVKASGRTFIFGTAIKRSATKTLTCVGM
jgi:hypothetical protein